MPKLWVVIVKFCSTYTPTCVCTRAHFLVLSLVHVCTGTHVFHYYMPYFTCWFLDIRITNVLMNMYPEGFSESAITITKCRTKKNIPRSFFFSVVW